LDLQNTDFSNIDDVCQVSGSFLNLLTALTKLSLDTCHIPARALACLASMTYLHHLSLVQIIPTASTTKFKWATVLLNLQQLTHLTVAGDMGVYLNTTRADWHAARHADGIRAHSTKHLITWLAVKKWHQGDILQGLSRLTALQELTCRLDVSLAGALAGLSALQSLTTLQLEGTRLTQKAPGSSSSSINSLPGRFPFTALQHLQLKDAKVSPDLLSIFPGLRRLEIVDAPLCQDSGATAAFLANLTQLQQLTYLQWSEPYGTTGIPACRGTLHSQQTACSRSCTCHFHTPLQLTAPQK
jgi:hypothetical protein